jgi:hypothetical protein
MAGIFEINETCFIHYSLTYKSIIIYLCIIDELSIKTYYKTILYENKFSKYVNIAKLSFKEFLDLFDNSLKNYDPQISIINDLNVKLSLTTEKYTKLKNIKIILNKYELTYTEKYVSLLIKMIVSNTQLRQQNKNLEQLYKDTSLQLYNKIDEHAIIVNKLNAVIDKSEKSYKILERDYKYVFYNLEYLIYILIINHKYFDYYIYKPIIKKFISAIETNFQLKKEIYAKYNIDFKLQDYTDEGETEEESEEESAEEETEEESEEEESAIIREDIIFTNDYYKLEKLIEFYMNHSFNKEILINGFEMFKMEIIKKESIIKSNDYYAILWLKLTKENRDSWRIKKIII